MSEVFEFHQVSIHAAAAFAVLAFLSRNQISLRFMLLFSNLLYAAFYLSQPDAPLVQAAAWSFAMTVSNGLMIGLLLWERVARPMDRVNRRLFEAFGRPIPGHFRRIIRHGKRKTTSQEVCVLEDGKVPAEIFFLFEGEAHIALGDRVITLHNPRFFGELSYTLSQPATGTVWFSKGSEYVVWEREKLDEVFRRSPVLRATFEQFLTRDMARKLSDAGHTHRSEPPHEMQAT
ncbi:MAG: hypothetical protein AAGA19_09150 [Pseudomonadota bacterium]